MANATNQLTPPHPNVVSKGPVMAKVLLISQTYSIYWGLVFNGTPTASQGAGWAGVGSLGVDETTGKMYSNRGTKAVPNWVEVSTA
jgi:hypothetical protein